MIISTDPSLVNIVHDEIILECDATEAETITSKLTIAKTRAGEEFIKKVPVTIDAHTADEWSK